MPAAEVAEQYLFETSRSKLRGSDESRRAWYVPMSENGARGNGIERLLAIGGPILNEFCHGDTAIRRERRRDENDSPRRLAERPDGPFCKSTLNEAVAVYVASLE